MGFLGTFFKSLYKQHKVNVFSLFLLLSLLLWSLIKLSQHYDTTMTFNVAYGNVPQDRTLLGEPLKQIDVNLRGNGFRLLNYAFFKPTVMVDLNKVRAANNDLFYVNTNQDLSLIQGQFPNEIKLIGIKPDSLFMHLGINKSKTLPVALDLEIQFEKGYNLEEKIILEPNEVSVSGREDLIDSIQALSTESIVLTEVDANFSQIAKLKIEERFDELNFSHTAVKVIGKVGKFTEGIIEVPIEVINLPDNVTIKLFPNKLEVLYVVGLSKFKDINSDNFKVICDYDEVEDGDKNSMTPKVTTNSPAIINYRLLQSKVEFLIKK